MKESAQSTRNTKITWKTSLVFLIIIVSIFAAVFFGLKWHSAQQSVNQLASGPQSASQKAVNNAVQTIGKLVILPTGETPTLATLKNVAQLKDQDFFVDAKDGDEVLIYPKAQEAILYRPSVNKIVNIGPVTQNSSSGNNSTNGINGGR